MAKDEKVLECLQAGSSQCECLAAASDGLRSCMGDCMHIILKALCPVDAADEVGGGGDGSAAAETASAIAMGTMSPKAKLHHQDTVVVAAVPPECSRSDAVNLTQACVSKNVKFVQCLESGATQCKCLLQGDKNLQHCMGMCWNTIYTAVCKVQLHDDNEEISSDTSSGTCSEAKALKLTDTCMKNDVDVVACLKTEQTECQCLSIASPETESCMGGCLKAIGAALCPSDGEPGQ